MNIRSLDFDMQKLVKTMIDMLESARQDAYEIAKEIPQLRGAFLEAETLYGKAVIQYGVPYKPVFDRDIAISEILSNSSHAPVERAGNTPDFFSKCFAYSS